MQRIRANWSAYCQQTGKPALALNNKPTEWNGFIFRFSGGKRQHLPLLSYTLSIHQETDSLGRPASLTLGGTITCVLSTPGSDKPFLHQWMFSPTMQEEGRLILMQDSPRATLKTISFFNAYCVGLQTNFTPGAGGGGSLQTQVRISSQRVAVGAIIHDNNWPLESHGAGQTFAQQEVPVKSKSARATEPGLLSDITHTALDVAGLVPVIGELADGANALFYLAEGNKTDAALSAAAMIPIAGMAATGAKLVRKGVKLADKAKALKKATDKVSKSTKAVAAVVKKVVPSPSKLATQWQGSGDYPGVDTFRDIVVKKGKIIYAGEPGASGFFFMEKAMKKAEGSTDKLWGGLQVKKHPKFGYRTKVGIYEAIEDAPGAFGIAKANADHGVGGLQQVYMPDMTKMKKIGEIDLK